MNNQDITENNLIELLKVEIKYIKEKIEEINTKLEKKFATKSELQVVVLKLEMLELKMQSYDSWTKWAGRLILGTLIVALLALIIIK